MTRERLPSSLRIVFVFLHKRGQDAVLGPLLVNEVVAEDLGIRLEFPVDAPVALLHTARVPGHVEVKEVPAVRLKIQSFTGGVGRDQDAQRMALGSALNAS